MQNNRASSLDTLAAKNLLGRSFAQSARPHVFANFNRAPRSAFALAQAANRDMSLKAA